MFQNFDLLAAIEQRGVTLKQHSHYYSGLCPFHPPKHHTPSFVV